MFYGNTIPPPCQAGRTSIFGAQDEAAANLLALADKIDTEKMGAPSALTIITGNGFACRRKDGVNVVPLSTLTA